VYIACRAFLLYLSASAWFQPLVSRIAPDSLPEGPFSNKTRLTQGGKSYFRKA